MLRDNFIQIVLVMTLVAVATVSGAVQAADTPPLDRHRPERTEIALFALG
jgi:hypothetical protein